MSQEKVDKYEEEKKNRKKLMKKEKFQRRLGLTVTLVAFGALVIWFCWALYGNAQAEKEANADPVTTELDLSKIEDYTSELSNYITEQEASADTEDSGTETVASASTSEEVSSAS